MLGQTAVVNSGSTCAPTLPCSRNAIQGLDSETSRSVIADPLAVVGAERTAAGAGGTSVALLRPAQTWKTVP